MCQKFGLNKFRLRSELRFVVNSPPLLHVKHGDGVGILEQQATRASVVNVLTVRRLNFLGDLVLQVLDHNLLERRFVCEMAPFVLRDKTPRP